MDLVDILPDVRHWFEVLCCTILTHISDLEDNVTDFEILCLIFWFQFLEALVDLVDTLPDIRYLSKLLCCTIPTFSLSVDLEVKVTDLEILR